MNKRDRMNEQILNHGTDLQRIFSINTIAADALARKVHRIEVKAHKLAEDYCNGLIEPDDWYEVKEKQVLKGLDRLLGFTAKGIPVIVNGDPRGYALKIDDEYVRAHSLKIHRDMGGYGILAPEFDGGK